MRVHSTYDHLWLCVETLFFALLQLAVFAFYFWLLVVLYVVNPQRAIKDLRAVQVVNGENSRPLVFVHKEAETL